MDSSFCLSVLLCFIVKPLASSSHPQLGVVRTVQDQAKLHLLIQRVISTPDVWQHDLTITVPLKSKILQSFGGGRTAIEMLAYLQLSGLILVN